MHGCQTNWFIEVYKVGTILCFFSLDFLCFNTDWKSRDTNVFNELTLSSVSFYHHPHFGWYISCLIKGETSKTSSLFCKIVPCLIIIQTIAIFSIVLDYPRSHPLPGSGLILRRCARAHPTQPRRQIRARHTRSSAREASTSGRARAGFHRARCVGARWIPRRWIRRWRTLRRPGRWLVSYSLISQQLFFHVRHKNCCPVSAILLRSRT